MNLNNLQEALSFFFIGFLELSVLFLGVSFLVEILNTFLNPQKVQKVLSSKKSGYLIASGLGSITPFCSCSSIPIFIGFTKAGLPVGITFSFLISSPLVDLASFLILSSFFGVKIALIYVVVGLILAVLGNFN